MKLEAEGSTVYFGEEVVSTRRLKGMAQVLGSASAEETAHLVPFFGPTMAGETHLIDVLGLDLRRALLGGITYEWVRPFRDGETVQAKVVVDKVFDKGSNRFGVVIADFTDDDGALIQRQSSTFIERRPT